MKLSTVLLTGLITTSSLFIQAQIKLKVGKEITTESGLKIRLEHKGNGELPKTGDNVSVHYTGRLTDSTKFDSSYDRNKPFSFKLGKGMVIKGWDEGVAHLHVGDKAVLTIPPELGYGDRDLGTIPPNSVLVFEVELLGITPPPAPFDVAGKDTIKLESGLQMIMVKSLKEGIQAEAFKTVSVHYTGRLMDGSIFDSSVERDQPIEFPLGVGRVIKGWDEGIAHLKVGEKARLIVPSDLGYGAKGYPPVIPANATLIFDVELVAVK